MDTSTTNVSRTQAGRIVQEYLRVLECVADLLTLGTSSSLLPAARDEVRTAIQVVTRNLLRHESPDGMDIDALRTAYLSLASFMSYEEAHAAARLHAAFKRGDQVYIASRVAAQTMHRAQQIEQEASALALEFDALVRQVEDHTLRLEIEHFISDYSARAESVTSR